MSRSLFHFTIQYFFHFLAFLVIAIGILHLAVTFFIYPRLSETALWFAIAGLALIFNGIINLICQRISSHHFQLRLVNVLTNGLMIVFCILLAMVMPEIQVFVLLFCFCILLFYPLKK